MLRAPRLAVRPHWTSEHVYTHTICYRVSAWCVAQGCTSCGRPVDTRATHQASLLTSLPEYSRWYLHGRVSTVFKGPYVFVLCRSDYMHVLQVMLLTTNYKLKLLN